MRSSRLKGYALVFFLNWLLPEIASANHVADSLKSLLLATHVDSLRAKLSAAIALKLSSENPIEALQFAKQAVDISKQISFKEGEALGYNQMGNCFKQQAKYDSAFYYYKKSNVIYSGIKNSKGEAITWMNIGTLHQKLGTYDSAFFYLFKSLKTSQTLSDSNVTATILGNLGMAMDKEGKFDDAINYYEQALKIFPSNADKNNVANTSQNLGITYAEKKDFARAKQYYLKALETYKTLNSKRGLGQVSINLSYILEEEKQYEEAFSYASKAVVYFKDIKNPNGEGEALLALGTISYGMNKNEDALSYALQALDISIQIGNHDTELKDYDLLHKVYAAKGDFKKAYFYSEKSASLNDSLFNVGKEKIVNELQTKYETEKKEHQISLLNKDKQLSEATISNQKTLRNSIIAGFCLLLIIAILIFNRYRLRQIQRRQTERMSISHDLHDEVGSTLSSIGIYSNHVSSLLNQQKFDEAKNILGEISNSSHQMIEDMNDIIWSVNPKNDSFERIISRLESFAVNVAASKDISVQFRAGSTIKSMILPMAHRKNLYLICKEAINNCVKYSGCSSLEINFKNEKKSLIAEIRDNGKGFDVSKDSSGNGLHSMRSRANDLHADLLIDSGANSGTLVKIVMPIQ
ncbi:MAG TPA: tetratricopeptide repeat protein [Chitinophagales bacterium]|nr:tetratricopeptide repeat protein [Chitinophagales bacterium]